MIMLLFAEGENLNGHGKVSSSGFAAQCSLQVSHTEVTWECESIHLELHLISTTLAGQDIHMFYKVWETLH